MKIFFGINYGNIIDIKILLSKTKGTGHYLWMGGCGVGLSGRYKQKKIFNMKERTQFNFDLLTWALHCMVQPSPLHK